jgi:peptidoglycan/xylan/chitin deacetylase (PgdA/CDA1 family)
MATTVCLSFDFDALSSWITSFKQTTPMPMSRGEYAARVGVPRVLDLLKSHEIPATFFIPGHTALTFPAQTRAIAAAGHEIGAHSFLHKSPSSMTKDEEHQDFERAEAALQEVAGVRPVGYRSPASDLSPHTFDFLVERGYLYASNLMCEDFRLFQPRSGDVIGADGTVTFGKTVPLVEFPTSWELDDFIYFQFLGKSLSGLRSAAEIGDIWFAEFDYCARHVQDGVVTLTLHPEVIGRGPRIVMLSRLIERMKDYPDVRFARMGDVARDWLANQTRGERTTEARGTLSG